MAPSTPTGHGRRLFVTRNNKAASRSSAKGSFATTRFKLSQKATAHALKVLRQPVGRFKPNGVFGRCLAGVPSNPHGGSPEEVSEELGIRRRRKIGLAKPQATRASSDTA